MMAWMGALHYSEKGWAGIYIVLQSRGFPWTISEDISSFIVIK
jgi:hypothetical protein